MHAHPNSLTDLMATVNDDVKDIIILVIFSFLLVLTHPL